MCFSSSNTEKNFLVLRVADVQHGHRPEVSEELLLSGHLTQWILSGLADGSSTYLNQDC